jgi:peroxiredoxin
VAQLRLLTELEKECRVAYSKIVAISIDPPDVNGALRNGLGAQFPILSDAERAYQDELTLREPSRRGNYIPCDFVLYPDLTIYKIYNGYNFWGRATTEDLRQDFRAISMEIRKDWDPWSLSADVLQR